ncbi:MAG: histidinol-phosphate aminotransferase family protein [Clostridiales bacterium]|nr:histidinol-phosphate aminotransferase family protein [Clostridiales bacterium]
MIYVNEKIKNTYRVPQPEGRGAYIRLDQNENPDGLPKWLFDSVMEKVTPEFLAIYPEETIPTTKYAHLLGLEKENVTLTDGSTVGMGYVIKVFGEPGKNILTVTPSFAMYEVYAKMIGMNVVQMKYENDFSFKVENILANINERTGIVVLVNPNMPVGNVYAKDDIRQIIEKAGRNNALVIIDEAYYYFYDQTSIDLVREYDNVVVLRTFSKMLSIPSLRLGAIMSCAENIRCINNYKPHYTVNSIALLFAEAIVDNHERLLSELMEQYLEGKEYIIRELTGHGYELIPSAGCYVCIKPKHKTSRELTDLLQENGILILCGKDGLTGWLRLTIAHKKYMELFLNTLLKIDKA